MALGVTIVKTTVVGDTRMTIATLAFDASYPTGGEALAASALKMSKMYSCAVEPNDGYVFTWDDANGKIIAYYADYDAVADGALIEVANTTDLSGITDARLVAFGV